MAPKKRIRPTASNRKNRSKDVGSSYTNVEVTIETEEGEQRKEVEVEVDSEIDEASKKGPFPGGPVNNELLVDYRHHLAYRIWNGKDRAILRCRQPVTLLDSWSLGDEANIFIEKVRESGLLPLAQYSFKTVNCPVISAMVERWYPKTNTFHLPIGEMGITLDDVYQIVGIPIMGRAVSRPTIPTSEDVNLVRRTLQINPTDIVDELNAQGRRAVRLSWLKDHLAKKTKTMPLHSIECAVRGYLLYLLGCTIFSDKSGSLVSVEYLQYLEDLDKVKDYAWGAAALVHLYRQLGIASRAKCRQISGYLTLLQTWVYEHILPLRPELVDHSQEGFPRASVWKNCRNSPMQRYNVKMIRELLDCLCPEQVDFDPYCTMRDRSPLPEYAFFKGCLVGSRVYEPYMPDRFIRQLGHIQSIPREPTQPEGKARRSRIAGSYKVTYGGNVTHMQQWENHVLAPNRRGPMCQRPWETVPEYMEWFRRVSHLIVQNPENRRFGQMIGISQVHMSSDEDWRFAIAQYLHPLVQGRHTAGILRRHIQNVIDYCEGNTPLPTPTPQSVSPVRARRSQRMINT